jgi:hypothetical protein
MMLFDLLTQTPFLALYPPSAFKKNTAILKPALLPSSRQEAVNPVAP